MNMVELYIPPEKTIEVSSCYEFMDKLQLTTKQKNQLAKKITGGEITEWVGQGETWDYYDYVSEDEVIETIIQLTKPDSIYSIDFYEPKEYWEIKFYDKEQIIETLFDILGPETFSEEVIRRIIAKKV